MKRIYTLLLFTGILLLNGCNNDEEVVPQPEGKNFAPQLKATVEENPATKSGVIEDNDYALGEKFYWSNGDATTVFFRNPGMTDATQYKRADYAASVAQGVQSKNCSFDVIQSESIDNGQYTAYGFFPTAAWDIRAEYSYEFLTANIPAYQIQNQANSTHLGAYMLMKAQNTVTVDGSSPINLTYKHLASVLRFAVWNNSGNGNLKLTNINVSLGSGKATFGTEARLTDIDAASLSVTRSLRTPRLTLSLKDGARNFSVKDGKGQCEGYMAVLPTATDAFESTDNLIIELSLSDGTNNYLITKTYNIGSSLGFLANGIEQGKSYYFQLKVDALDLINPITGTSYAVGDYWPNSTAPEGIVFWVNPGTFGTQGRVVALNETFVTKWGVEKDEQAAGITGIRSVTDGAAATKSMIAHYKGSPTFESDYPVFYYIYHTVNSDNENGVWYLPARDELRMLFMGYSGKVYESMPGRVAIMPDNDSPECIAARSAFNAKLTAKSGMALCASGNPVAEWYLSSSETLAPAHFSFSFSSGLYSFDGKDLGGNVRWIREY